MYNICKIIDDNEVTASRDLGLGVTKVLYGNINGKYVDYEVHILDSPDLHDDIYPIYSSCELEDLDKVIERELA